MFSIAKCGHCGNSGTKITSIEPNQSAYKLSAICCAHCNAILGVMDYYNTGTLLKGAEKEIGVMNAKIDRLQYQVDQLLRAVSR